MHRIEWTHKGESYSVATDQSRDEVLSLFVNVRANLGVERDEATRGLLSEAADALGRLAEHIGGGK
jgi:hypothetical protein